MSRDLLWELHRDFLDEQDLRPDRDQHRDFEDGLAWACAPAVPGARGCLVTLGDSYYLPLDYLVDRSGTLDDTQRPETFWRTLLDHVAAEDARLLGVRAYPPHDPQDPAETAISEQAFRLAADAGDRLAMSYLGHLQDDLARRDEAEQSYRRALAHGHVMSWYHLGGLHASTQRAPSPPQPTITDGPEELRLVYDMGYRQADYELALNFAHLLRRDTSDSETARLISEEYHPELDPSPWLRRAAESGHVESMVALAGHLEPLVVDRPDDIQESAHWFRRAADVGHSRSMYRLACLLEKAGRTDDAAHWHNEAIKHGEGRSVRRLGELLTYTGRASQAERLFRLAIAHGHTDIKEDLDFLLAAAAAPAASRRAPAETTGAKHRNLTEPLDADAILQLGIHMRQSRDFPEAERCYLRAARSGHLGAMVNLGYHLERDRRGPYEPLIWYRRAALRGQTDAMYNLGCLYQRAGNHQEATHWYRKAILNRHLAAARALLELTAITGRIAEAEQLRVRFSAWCGRDPMSPDVPTGPIEAVPTAPE